MANWWEDEAALARYRANVAARNGVVESARPRPQPAAARATVSTVVELGGKLDRLTALVESVPARRVPVRENAPTPTPTPEPAPVEVPTAAEMAAMSPEAFREWSAIRWSGAFDHLAAGSPYSRAYGTPGPLLTVRGDGGA
jgi:hypothetical protein